jgi:hypothetical protein
MQQPPYEQWQQPPWQPNQPPPYPQQPYYQPPPMFVQPPPKPRPNGCLIAAAIFIALGLCGLVISVFEGPHSSTTSTTSTVQTTDIPTPTDTPSRSPTWTTVQTFNGYLSEKTAYFTIQKRWRISWSCTNSDVSPGATGSFMVIAYDRAGHTISGDTFDPIAVSGDCPVADAPTTGIGPVQKHGGTIYLDVSATGDWTIEVQVLK